MNQKLEILDICRRCYKLLVCISAASQSPIYLSVRASNIKTNLILIKSTICAPNFLFLILRVYLVSFRTQYIKTFIYCIHLFCSRTSFITTSENINYKTRVKVKLKNKIKYDTINQSYRYTITTMLTYFDFYFTKHKE